MALSFGTTYASAFHFPYTCLLDSTHFIGIYQDGSGFPTAVLGTISAGAISYGTPLTLVSVNTGTTALCALDSTHFVFGYNDGSNIATVNIGTVSGTTITKGTAKNLDSASPTSAIWQIVKIDATDFLCFHMQGTYGQGVPNAVVCSYSGSTITENTSASPSATVCYQIFACLIDSTHFLMVYDDGTHYNSSIIVGTISGTTITYGSAVQITSGTTRSQCHTLNKLDSTHYVLQYDTNGGNSTFVIVTVSGTTPTVNTPVSFASDTYFGIGNQVAILDSTDFIYVYGDISANGYAVTASISGTTITMGTPVEYDSTGGSVGEVVLAISSSSVIVSGTKGSYSRIGTIAPPQIFLPNLLGMKQAVNRASTY